MELDEGTNGPKRRECGHQVAPADEVTHLDDTCVCCGTRLGLDDPDLLCAACHDDHGPLPYIASALLLGS